MAISLGKIEFFPGPISVGIPDDLVKLVTQTGILLKGVINKNQADQRWAIIHDL